MQPAIWARGQIMFDLINAFKGNSILFFLSLSLFETHTIVSADRNTQWKQKFFQSLFSLGLAEKKAKVNQIAMMCLLICCKFYHQKWQNKYQRLDQGQRRIKKEMKGKKSKQRHIFWCDTGHRLGCNMLVIYGVISRFFLSFSPKFLLLLF